MRKSQCVCEREGPRERERETNSVRERQPFGEVKALVSEPDNREADHGAEESVCVCVRERERQRKRVKEREKERERARERESGRARERESERARERERVCV